jgi:hypothetical protein
MPVAAVSKRPLIPLTAWALPQLGEIQGLQVSLTKAKENLTALDRSQDRLRKAGPVSPGIPAIALPAKSDIRHNF